MKGILIIRALLLTAMALSLLAVRAGESIDPSVADEIKELRRELAQVKTELQQPPQDTLHAVDALVRDQSDGGSPVVTRGGNLVIHGLVQVWYQYIQNDSKGWEDATKVLGSSPAMFGSNQTRDNDTFRIRRAEICFDYSLSESISARIKVDPAAEVLGYPSAPSNQAPFYNAGFQAINGQGQFGQGCPPMTGMSLCSAGIGNPFNQIVRNGSGDANRLLEDAYINYHNICFLPCHDIQIGQMKRRLGEEGYRNNGELDFAERSMITQVADDYDLGVQLHGSFFCNRLQYWAGVFDGAGTAFQSRANRSDDNDKKDFLGSVVARPIWDHCFWGSFELGYSGLFGKGGESAGSEPITAPLPGLNRRATSHGNQYAWLYYAPGAALKGLWLRSEWGQYRDRFAPGEVVTGLFNYTDDPKPFNIYGYYGAIGYRFSESNLAKHVPAFMCNMELAYRHEQMENLFYQNLQDTNRGIDVFRTTVDTVGLNWYLKGSQAKIQLNYNFVKEQHNHSTGDRQLREVRNDNLVLNFQVAF